jgi:uncharacterized membrane protein
MDQQDLSSHPSTPQIVQRRAIERYIRAIIHMQMKDIGKRSRQDRLADVITAFSGSMLFVYIHIAWFVAWILVNTGLIGIPPFDPFPYGLLTMIVSLEAIFLSTFVLISQNREAKSVEHRNELDLHIDLLTEYELTRVIQMLHLILDKLDVHVELPEDLAELEEETDPEEILDKIEKLQEHLSRMRRGGSKNNDKDEEE